MTAATGAVARRFSKAAFGAKRSFGTEVCSEISEQVKYQRSARRADCCIECYCNVILIRA